ncbi:MAG: hypothetical protein JOZ99_06190 [Actinobacteria bacterium]|nr:hypothetical protein [Actinomycetota bacterium]
MTGAPPDQKVVRIRPRPRLPSDRDAAEEEVVRAFSTVYGGGATVEERCARIEGGANLGATMREAEQRRPWPEPIDISVDALRFIADDEAEVRFVLLLPAGPVQRVPYLGHAVLDGGRWKVARSTYCDLVSSTGVRCPPAACIAIEDVTDGRAEDRATSRDSKRSRVGVKAVTWNHQS